jgi:transposase
MNDAVDWTYIATQWWHVCQSSRASQRRKEIRTFRTVTKEVLAMRQWLLSEGCSHVGMESTGVLWRPIYDRLTGYFELVLVNAVHMRQVPGRKTDVQDADWLADLLQHGLLTKSFVPDPSQQDLRDLTRLRVHLVQDRAQLINRILKVLQQGGIKLSGVLELCGRGLRTSYPASTLYGGARSRATRFIGP